ncbi:DUF3916 domain-containing protein [Burkholderia pyrrocinia]|uniref:DUF3916 domain-containing protein n=1 Tax=Burkholderia pyrrocinia TaxID=60550 RepID=A0A2Z5N6Z2_BURPY|nr:DUF3916 domain-containing protein [Burkholderia pyrrocinia]AXF25343.1 DUF3916 domain-containing protein [Burkholderia pyrrocinia]
MPEKKLRGIPRRLRAVRQWPEKLSNCIPADVWNSNELYWNWKIPVLSSLVRGRYATVATRRTCAQGLIDASAFLLARKPTASRSARVTCAISLPDMFASEVCVYLDEDYFSAHVDDGASIFGERNLIRGRKLSSEWMLHVPPGMSELGIAIKDLDDDGRPFMYECWYFGEVTR